jgi:hypothetical protein
MCMINRRRVKGVADWTREHTPYIASWNVRERIIASSISMVHDIGQGRGRSTLGGFTSKPDFS